MVLIPVGLVILLVIPWPDLASEMLWVGLFLTFSVLLALPAAVRMWNGDREPEPLPPSPLRR